MKEISIDDGTHFCDPEEAIKEMDWDVIVQFMADETREQVHAEIAPCANLDFLKRYLEIATDDLIIG
ncbi:MAG TPA: hypothetical protein IAD34_09285 [Candidatus Scatovicinus merdipullorum]|nr:hypothetical protein [Candidatus Scatovicinus merdipullorum]